MSELLRRLLSRPLVLAELLLASLLISVLGLASTLFVMLVLNRYVPYGVDATLATLTAGVTLAALLEYGFREARHGLAAGLVWAGDDLRAEAGFAVLLRTRMAALDRVPATARQEIVRGIETVQHAFSPGNVTALLDLPFSLVSIGALFLLSPLLGWLAVLAAGASVVVTMVGARVIQPVARAVGEGEGRLHSLLAVAVHSPDTLRAFNAASFAQDQWAEAHQRLDRARTALVGSQTRIASICQVIATLQGIAVITVGAVLCVRGDLSTGALIGANILAARALAPINRLAQLTEPLARAELALHRLVEFAHLPHETSAGMALKAMAGRIELVDVALAIPGTAQPLAEHVSLTVEPGHTLVVAGPSGSGKTTFARLLLGLAEPARGQIRIDGVDLHQISLDWWRSQVCYLPQEPGFVEASVADNIRLANPAIDDGGLSRVLAAAGLKGWIDTTPLGWDTPVVEGGRHVPPGLRRRLALARALAGGGQVVVFDEPTEGMDADGRAIVYALLNELTREGRTLVVCSNDPAIVRGAHVMVDLEAKPVPRIVHAPEAAHA